ncbi:lamin tail domain-containing protein, partial [Verrucomicrobiota bacterium]
VELRASPVGPDLSAVDYRDRWEWPTAADGAGHSLVPLLQGKATNEIPDYGGNWRASAYIGGSPGRGDPEPVRDVVINEVMAHTDYTNELHPEYDSNDWIEFYNTTAEDITLEDWYLSDDAADLMKWHVPAGTVITGEGWLVFDEVSGFHNPVTNGFGLNKGGERVFLAYLPGGTNDRVADCVRFKGQEADVTLGRYPDGGVHWSTLTPTAGAANALPRARVVIDEIMYHPRPTAQNPEDNTQDEFIRLHNPTPMAVDLWTESGPWRIDGSVDFVFPPGVTMAAGSDLRIVSFDPSDPVALSGFLDVYGLPPGEVAVLGPYRGVLSNRVGRIALERPQAADGPADTASWVVVDRAIYFNRPPWPREADGTGRSLVRKSPAASGLDPANWSASLPGRLLLLHWAFDEASGLTALDGSGRGHDGELLDIDGENGDGDTPPRRVAGRSGGALSFDGADDTSRADGVVVGAFPFALMAWVRTTDQGAEATAVFVGKGNQTWDYYTVGVSAGRAEIAALTHVNPRLRRSELGDTIVADGRWHHVAGVFLGPTDKRLYVDGAMEGVLSQEAASTGALRRVSAGHCDHGAPSGAWPGDLDDVRLYTAAIAEGDLQTIMAETAGGDEDGDGMGDSWEEDYFGSTNVSQGEADEDWDEDGLPDRDEYTAGTDPTDRADLFELWIDVSNGTPRVRLFGRESSGPHYAGRSRRYALDRRQDLGPGDWSPVPDFTNIPGLNQWITYTNLAGDMQMYYRGKVRLEAD